MLWTLIRIRLQALMQSFLIRSAGTTKQGKGRTILVTVLMVYAVACFFFLFGQLFTSLLPLQEAGYDWLYFGYMGILGVALSVFLGMFMAQNILFSAKDNELLLSMPIKPGHILLSRICVLYAMNLLYTGLIGLPAIWVYCRALHPGIGQILVMVLCLLLLPLLSNAVSSLIGWALAWLNTKVRRKNLISAVVSLLFLAVYFYGYSKITDYVNYLLVHAGDIAESLRAGAFPVYHLGNAMATGSLVSLLCVALITIAPFLLVYYLLSRSFIRITTSTGKTRRIAYREKAMREQGVSFALVQREIRRFCSNPMVMLNAALGIPFMVVLSVLFVIQRDMVTGFLPAMNMTGAMLPAIAALLICACGAMNFISAPSVSLEGKNLWILRSMPVSSGDILCAKANAHVGLCLPFVLLSVLICLFGIGAADALSIAGLVLLPVGFTLLTAYLGVVINLQFPKLEWMNEVAVVKQSASTLISMFACMLLVLLPTLLYGMLINYIDVSLYVLLWAALFLAGTWILRGYLRGRGAARFETL